MDFNCILIRYGEIGLKGGNRQFFERKLVENIRSSLDKNLVEYNTVKRIQGRYIIETNDDKALNTLKNVFGTVSHSPALKTSHEKMVEEAIRLVKEKKPNTFRITSRRLDKTMETTSQIMNTDIGAKVVEETGCKVKLKQPDLDIGIDVTKKDAYIYTKTIKGLGGLPVGVSARVICLHSGGIDSPVAAWLMMKRGCNVTLLHFMHGSGKKAPSKIGKQYEILKKYDPRLKLILVPSKKLENEIILKIPSKSRIVLLRRMFLKATKKILIKEKAHAIITGDNIGQVASQTIENMQALQTGIDALIIRPLATYDKKEIIDIAEKIGTIESSNLPYEDCCSFLLAKHPETKATIEEVKELEEKIDEDIIDEIIGEILLL